MTALGFVAEAGLNVPTDAILFANRNEEVMRRCAVVDVTLYTCKLSEFLAVFLFKLASNHIQILSVACCFQFVSVTFKS